VRRLALFIVSACLLVIAALRGQQSDGARPYVLGWNGGELLTDSQGRTTSITVSPETTGSTDLSFWTTEIPPDSNILVHRHDRTEEILFVHRGTGTLLLGDEQLEVREGATIYVPSDRP
jgi:mannose-6-phosphate isomerase-like protein (cupin superfamily)